VASHAITIPDGRRLSWYEFGDPDGSAVIYTAGTPVSGQAGASYDRCAPHDAPIRSAGIDVDAAGGQRVMSWRARVKQVPAR
jgi:hypothetical protein